MSERIEPIPTTQTPEANAPATGTAEYVERAYREKVPAHVVAARCHKRGLPYDRAQQVAEEAAAEAYLRALRRVFENETHFRAWVTYVAANCAVDILRRTSRTTGLAALPDVAANLQTDRAAEEAELEQALSLLDAEGRALLDMSYLQGLTLDQMAEQILSPDGASLNARRLRVKRLRDAALKELRSRLGMNP